MLYDMQYDGRILKWIGKGTFKATSGMPGYQEPTFQCDKEKGPVPEGNYYIPLIKGDLARDDGTGVCKLAPSWQIQRIPRGSAAGACEPYWANWGHNRVRFEPADVSTKNACTLKRSGFYLHDSTKGYSHGCIEVEALFFSVLRIFLKQTNKMRLTMKIKYSGNSTYGGTKSP